MSRRSFSLPGRPLKEARLQKAKRKWSLQSLRSQRKRVHWSVELEEVFYFESDSVVAQLSPAELKMRQFLSRPTLVKNGALSLKSVQSNTSLLFQSGVHLLTQEDITRGGNLGALDLRTSSRWEELLRLYQRSVHERLQDQIEEWV